VRFAGLEATPLYIHAMHLIGWLMIILFAWLYFVPFAKFKSLVNQQSYPDAASMMNTQMRPIIAINLTLGIVEAIIGASGSFWGV
ncbi:MAG: hypothetical protein R3254_07200, partial [Thiomicrorhabdus sp.]|nr:hypothetical protein [Thiomicrorhabdus sp.]